MPQSVMFLTEDIRRASQRAADFLHRERGVKVDAKRIADAVSVLVDRIRDGMKLPAFAVTFGTTTLSKAGKPIASRPIQARWRLAEYLHATREHPEYRNKLETGYSMTADGAGKLCTALKPELVAAGLVSNKGRTTDDVSKRQAQAVIRAYKRLTTWTEKGIKATDGARQDIPAFDAVAGMQQALDGATVETLTAFYAGDKPVDKPETPRVRRPRARKPAVNE